MQTCFKVEQQYEDQINACDVGAVAFGVVVTSEREIDCAPGIWQFAEQGARTGNYLSCPFTHASQRLPGWSKPMNAALGTNAMAEGRVRVLTRCFVNLAHRLRQAHVTTCVGRTDVYDLSKVHFCIAQAAFHRWQRRYFL